MKNLFWFLFLLLAGGMQAQTLSAGPKAGVQVGDYSKLTDTRTALLGFLGGFVRYQPQAGKMDFQGEILLSKQGVNDAESDIYRERTHYLHIPLLAGYTFGDKIRVQAGLTPAILLGAVLKINDDGFKEKLDWSHHLTSFDLALTLAGEYQVTDDLAAGMRLNLGLLEVRPEYPGVRQNFLQLYVSYRLFDF